MRRLLLVDAASLQAAETLALLLVYRDWRPIIASATFFAVHHVLFDRLQAGLDDALSTMRLAA